MSNPSKQTRGLSTSLIGRKCTAKYAHLWFGSSDASYPGLLPIDQGTIVAAFSCRENDSTIVKFLVESDKGEIHEFYVEHVILVPEIK